MAESAESLLDESFDIFEVIFSEYSTFFESSSEEAIVDNFATIFSRGKGKLIRKEVVRKL